MFRITLLLLASACLLTGILSAQNTADYQLFFDTDSFTASFDEEQKFKAFVKGFDTVTISHISILGYCDDVGSTADNEILSKKRVDYVSQLLIALNINQALIQSEGKGELALSDNANKALERTHNRRVDITFGYMLKEKKKVIETKVEPTKNNNGKLSDDQKVGDKITLENILFVGGRHVLLPESYKDLNILTTTLLEKNKYHILILGHICCIDDEQDGLDFDTGIYNLSVARAKVIYDYLVEHGVSAERLKYKGLKADYPTGKGDKKDRRVEIEITKIVSD